MKTPRPALLLVVLGLAGAPALRADVAPVGAEFQANTFTTLAQTRPAVAASPDGRFVIVWQSGNTYGPAQDGSAQGVFGQRYDSSGARLGAEFQVNSYTTDRQLDAAVAPRGSGAFAVAWSSGSYFGPGQDGSAFGAFARRFDGTGAPEGPEVQANTYATGGQRNPAVATGPAGSFVVVWSSDNYGYGPTQDGSGPGIFAQRYDGTGARAGTEFQVNTHTTGYQYTPAVTVDASGSFVVVWTSSDYYGPPQDGSGAGVFGRRFTAGGTPLGAEFQVNTYTSGYQRFPSVAAAPAGAFVVAWESGSYYQTQDGSDRGVFAQRFDGAGVPAGPEFRVNTYTSGSQSSPAVAADAAGNFAVVWWSSGYAAPQDGSQGGIFGQHFSSAGVPLGPEFRVNTYTTADQGLPSLTADAEGRFVVAWRSGYYPPQDGSGAGIFAQRLRTTATAPAIAASGRRLVLRDDPDDGRRKTLAARSVDPLIALGGGNGSSDDPTLTGGRVRVRGGAFDDTYELPAGNWRHLGASGQNRGYLYRDPALLAGPITLLRLKTGRLATVTGLGAELGHTLGVNPDPVTVIVQLGAAGPRFCMTFGGATRFRPGRTYRAKGAPPVACGQ